VHSHGKNGVYCLPRVWGDFISILWSGNTTKWLPLGIVTPYWIFDEKVIISRSIAYRSLVPNRGETDIRNTNISFRFPGS